MQIRSHCTKALPDLGSCNGKPCFGHKLDNKKTHCFANAPARKKMFVRSTPVYRKPLLNNNLVLTKCTKKRLVCWNTYTKNMLLANNPCTQHRFRSKKKRTMCHDLQNKTEQGTSALAEKAAPKASLFRQRWGACRYGNISYEAFLVISFSWASPKLSIAFASVSWIHSRATKSA